MKKIFSGIFDNCASVAGAVVLCILAFALVLGLAFGILCFEAWILMLLWNAVIPTLFVGAPMLTFWLSMGLMLICHILFKSNVRVSKSDS